MAMTPAARSSGVRDLSLLSAPRSLKEPVGCSVSSFSTMLAPVSADNAGAATAGVRSPSPAMVAAASRISARHTGNGFFWLMASFPLAGCQHQPIAVRLRAQAQPFEIAPLMQQVVVVRGQRV